MKTLGRILALSMLSSALTILAITACGGSMGAGGNGGGGTPQSARAFVFNWRPVHLLGTRFGVQRAAADSPFVVNAQAPAAGGGNLQGICDAVNPSSGRAATVLFNLGRWSSGSCQDAATPDSDVGVTIPQTGQIGNLTVDATGLGAASNSGQMEVKVIHSDGSQTILPLTCSLGVSAAGSKVHCEDKSAADHANVSAGDQVSARIFYNAGDSYRAIRVNIEYATPTF